MPISLGKMFQSKPLKPTYDGTVKWLVALQRECDHVFDRYGKQLHNKSKPIPYELKRTDTDYHDGSWSPLFRILRPERIENVVNVIRAYEFSTNIDEEMKNAKHLYVLVGDIIKKWMGLIDQLGGFYADPELGNRLKSKFSRLATYCKLFVLNQDRIASGEIYDRDSYRMAFNEFVKCYEELPLESSPHAGESVAYFQDQIVNDIVQRMKAKKPQNEKNAVRLYYANIKHWRINGWVDADGKRKAFDESMHKGNNSSEREQQAIKTLYHKVKTALYKEK